MVNDWHEGLPSGQEEDKELALAFQRGDDGAYQAIHDRHKTRVRSICRRMLGSEDDAQEASQEVFLRVYQGLIRFNGRYQLQAWVTRISTNVCLDHLRARQRRPADATPVDELDLNPSGYAEDTDPQRLFIRKTEGRRVRRILNSLPPMHRAAIVLRDFEGLTYAEVALALEITEGQVKALLHRARNGFKRSWLSPLSILFPLRIGRLRRIDQPAKESGAQDAASTPQIADVVASTTQVATSCSSVLQQCGQFVGERVAPILTAAIVGTATVGVAAATHPEPAAPVRVSDEADDSVSASTRDNPPNKKNRTASQAQRTDAGGTGTTTSGAGDAPPSPTPSVTPSTSPSPSPSPSGGSSGDAKPTPSPTPSPTPTPTPFTAAVGFHRAGEPIPSTQPSSRKESISCGGQYFDQSLVTTVSYKGQFYPATLQLYARGSAGRIELAVSKDGEEVRYSSWGPQPVVSWSRSEQNLSLEIDGQYGPRYGSHPPEDVGLPASGSFHVEVTVDCTALSVVTESVGFTYE